MTKRELKKRILSLLLVLGLVLLVAGGNGETSRVGELKQIEKELQSEKLKLKAVKKKEANALNKLYSVNRQLKKAKQDLTQTKVNISQNKKRIVLLTEELRETKRKLKERGEFLSRRVREAYKSGGGLDLLELLFASKSIADFINKGYYFEKIVASDIALVGEIREKMDAVAEAKQGLEKALQKSKVLVKRIENREKEIESQAKIKKKIYTTLRERRKEYERRVAELEKGSKQLEGLIQQKAKGGKASLGATGRMIWPARGRVVSRFGYRRHPLWGGTHFHTGVDIGAPYGDPVRSADGGEVIFSGWWDGYGKAIVVDHGKGIATVYGHLARIYVEAGQRIEKGQILGLVGSTGFSTGPHLHFEVRRNGRPINPLGFLI